MRCFTSQRAEWFQSSLSPSPTYSFKKEPGIVAEHFSGKEGGRELMQGAQSVDLDPGHSMGPATEPSLISSFQSPPGSISAAASAMLATILFPCAGCYLQSRQ